MAHRYNSALTRFFQGNANPKSSRDQYPAQEWQLARFCARRAPCRIHIGDYDIADNSAGSHARPVSFS